ncbi:hypothetical protein [Streptomyces sp. NPDC048669]|uniref:hypothetical protein n=1 Tax=Streptomyces sp. NPDC048669 TaxID=3155267 RepID=UPI00341EBA6E
MFDYKFMGEGYWDIRVFPVSEETPAESVMKASEEAAKGGSHEYHVLPPGIQVNGGEDADAERTYKYNDEQGVTHIAVDHRFKAVEDGKLYAIVVYGPKHGKKDVLSLKVDVVKSFRAADSAHFPHCSEPGGDESEQ